MGIVETERLIKALGDVDIATLVDINLDDVYAELSDLDKEESLKLADDIFHLVIKAISIMSFMQIATVWTKIIAIFSLILKCSRH